MVGKNSKGEEEKARCNSNQVSPDSAREQKLEKTKEKEAATANEQLAVEKRLAELEREKKEWEERCFRVAAEFDNYRKRVEKEKQEIFQMATEKLVRSLLPFDEIFEKVLRQIEEDTRHAQSVRQGLQMLQKEISNILAELGVTRIETVGKPFNPFLHEAVGTVETDKVPEQYIVEEERAGYRLKEQVIRPAVVKVAVRPACSQPSDDPEKNSSKG